NRKINHVKAPNYTLKFIDCIESAKFFKYKNEDKLKLLEQKISDSVIVVNLPPKSTSRIEQTSNYRWYRTVEYVEIDHQRYTVEELQQKLIKVKTDGIFKIE
ncbi:MAG TPA: hypothetical protein VF455_07870, partial [Chryseobacterium sp.]